MTAGGQDGSWTAFTAIITALTGGLLARETLRTGRLRWRLRAAGRSGRHAYARTPCADTGSWHREFRSTWPLLFAATAVTFAMQENLEHLAAGEVAHGLGAIIGGEHPFAVPVMAIVSAAVAAVSSLIRCRVRTIELRVARATGPSGGRHPRSA